MTLRETLGVAAATLLLVYYVGDITNFWQASPLVALILAPMGWWLLDGSHSKGHAQHG